MVRLDAARAESKERAHAAAALLKNRKHHKKGVHGGLLSKDRQESFYILQKDLVDVPGCKLISKLDQHQNTCCVDVRALG